MEFFKILSNIDLFQNLLKKEIMALLENSQIHQIKANDFILKKSEEDSNIKIIIKGEAFLYRRNGSKIKLGVGSYFGELNLLQSSEVIADVFAQTDVDILVLPYNEIHKCYSKEIRIYGILMENLARVLSIRLKKAGETILKLTS